jgi:hypothetical protein
VLGDTHQTNKQTNKQTSKQTTNKQINKQYINKQIAATLLWLIVDPKGCRSVNLNENIPVYPPICRSVQHTTYDAPAAV